MSNVKLNRHNPPPIISVLPIVLDSAEVGPAAYVVALAHEIRNPLCNINLALEMLDPAELGEDVRLYLDIIKRGSGRIRDLVNALLISERAREVRFEFCSLHQLLDEVLIMAKDRISLKQVSVSTEYTATDDAAFVDKEHMKVALSNIVVNAIEAMPPEAGELELVTRSNDQLISIEIRDNGMGISNENQKRIFEPFFTNKPGGMGLGLSATLDILRANHTRVDVRSEEGLGTCFTLSFDRK